VYAPSTILIIICKDEFMSNWILGTDRFLTPYTPTFIANGYLGITGDWLGIGAGECHIANIYNRAADPADTVRARLPAYQSVDIHNGLHWLAGTDRNTTLIRNYSQELDLYTATLTTRYRWHDGDLRMDIVSNSFVCRHNQHLAVQQISITPFFSGQLQLQACADARRGDLQRQNLKAGTPETILPNLAHHDWTLLMVPNQRDQVLAIATALEFSGASDDYTHQLMIAEQSGINLTFEAQANQTYTLTRYVCVGELTADAATTHAIQARVTGYEALHAAHATAWAELWQGAIEIDGDEEAQKVIRASQYGLLSSLRAGSGWSISPMGISTRGYGGHIFWDADTWIYPAMLLTHPELAQGCVEYRCNRLEGARAKAQKAGYQGVMFPWEGDDLGVETTPDWAPCGEYEQHVTSCVAIAVWQWWQATGDKTWLREKAWPLLGEAATFWVSRVTPTPAVQNSDPDLRYHILDVQAADEYALHVDDNAWTNASAARCLALATQTATILGEIAPTEWQHVAERIYIPFDNNRQLTLEYEGYTDAIIKQADVVLLQFPLEWPLAAEVAANNARYYATRIDSAHGPAMTYAIHAILAAEAGDQAQLDEYLRLSYQHNLRPPFYSFSETPDLDYCTFVTGAGGLIQAILFGCCGARLTDAGLTFPHAPLLPTGWRRLRTCLRCGGKTYRVEVTATGRTVEVV
jgi:trehalose/maltose hydrolase-like predicted phosphorylase